MNKEIDPENNPAELLNNRQRAEAESANRELRTIVDRYEATEIETPEELMAEIAPLNIPELQEAIAVFTEVSSRLGATKTELDAARNSFEDAVQRAAEELSPVEVSSLSPEQNQDISNHINNIENERDNIERLPLGAEQARDGNNGKNSQATSVLGRVHQAAKEFGRKPKASYRGEEEQALEEYARSQGIWIEDLDAALRKRFLDKGLESRVYAGPDGTTVIKGNDGKSFDSWIQYLDNLALSNIMFPDVVLILRGFGMVTDSSGNKTFGAVVEQPRVMNGEVVPQELITGEMAKLGYLPTHVGAYFNPVTGISIEDLHPKNVLRDDDGNFRFIDAQMFYYG